ncbi:MAG TPA: hypothetical protein VKP59_07030 [Candidatus Thermoplasmatota archaeon]|nr:hypothetical protein [Candidatus Thermoplasmatota archaeon]
MPEKAIISKLKNKLKVTVFEKYSFDIYRKINNVSRQNAKRDLSDLVEKEILKQKGKRRGTRYILRTKRTILNLNMMSLMNHSPISTAILCMRKISVSPPKNLFSSILSTDTFCVQHT